MQQFLIRLFGVPHIPAKAVDIQRLMGLCIPEACDVRRDFIGNQHAPLEAAKLQGMGDLKFKNRTFALAQSRCYEALGNAVNVDIVQMIAERLLPANE